MSSPKLFQAIQLGDITLQHRVVLAPLTRLKATSRGHVPILPMVSEYYSQRSSIPGTLLITEGTIIAAKAGGNPAIPGIWNEDQLNAWKEVVKQVHANGSSIFLQLWAEGRAAIPQVLASEDPTFKLVAPSPIAMSSQPDTVPHELTVTEIQEYVDLFAKGAQNAVKAGFDGVEVHGANGYLVDQFLQDVANTRTDGYGGSIEARSTFGLEVIDAIVSAVGPKKTAIRLSPWSRVQDMGMADPLPQFSHFVTQLKERHPDLAYLHIIEPRVMGNMDRDHPVPEHESNDFIQDIWAPKLIITSGGHTRESALQVAEKGNLVSFGRLYISNPDLPRRLKEDIPLTPYNRQHFYVPGEMEGSEIGYIDYPFAPGRDVDPIQA